mmetsp:Transcript_16740/g.38487  ORF Transcript_16740/g.38487 Transcript_16740/m.38487 type:complete len:288 (+) Transcript_16740:3-866(+)
MHHIMYVLMMQVHIVKELYWKRRRISKKNKSGGGGGGGSLVNCGIPKRPIEIDRVLTPGIRCTVQLDDSVYSGKSSKGIVVSPSAPRHDNGTYWGYTTRIAKNLKEALNDCPFGKRDDGGGYTLKIGTSERGNISVDDDNNSGPFHSLLTKKSNSQQPHHVLIVFGGVAGIEECIDADETMKLPGSRASSLFDLWINTCPFQGSRTIRTEEAILISLARLSPYLSTNAANDDNNNPKKSLGKKERIQNSPVVEFSDEEPSDETSSSNDDDDDDNNNDDSESSDSNMD